MDQINQYYCRDLRKFIYDKFGKNRLSCKLSTDEKTYLKQLNENMKANSVKRVESIQKRIINDISNNIYTKKYQVNSLVEYLWLFRFVSSLDIQNHHFEWSKDPNGLTMNKLNKIVKSYQEPMIFISTTKPVRYCYFTPI